MGLAERTEAPRAKPAARVDASQAAPPPAARREKPAEAPGPSKSRPAQPDRAATAAPHAPSPAPPPSAYSPPRERPNAPSRPPTAAARAPEAPQRFAPKAQPQVTAEAQPVFTPAPQPVYIVPAPGEMANAAPIESPQQPVTGKRHSAPGSVQAALCEERSPGASLLTRSGVFTVSMDTVVVTFGGVLLLLGLLMFASMPKPDRRFRTGYKGNADPPSGSFILAAVALVVGGAALLLGKDAIHKAVIDEGAAAHSAPSPSNGDSAGYGPLVLGTLGVVAFIGLLWGMFRKPSLNMPTDDLGAPELNLDGVASMGVAPATEQGAIQPGARGNTATPESETSSNANEVPKPSTQGKSPRRKPRPGNLPPYEVAPRVDAIKACLRYKWTFWMVYVDPETSEESTHVLRPAKLAADSGSAVAVSGHCERCSMEHVLQLDYIKVIRVDAASEQTAAKYNVGGR